MSINKACLLLILVSGLFSPLLQADVLQTELPDNQWRQISLPVNPGGKTVRDLLGNDLVPADYGVNWVLFAYAPTQATYFDPGIDGVLQQGVGYWIIQVTGQTVTLTLTRDVVDPVDIVIPLETRAGETGWNMIGYPHADPTELNRLVIMADSGVCADADGCGIDEAEQAGIIHNQFFSLEAGAYITTETQGAVSTLLPWRGYWVATLATAQGLNPKIIFPVPQVPSITLSAANIHPDEDIQVTVTGLSGDEDWVGIYRKADSNDWDNVVSWAWATQETFTVPGVAEAGEYEARLFFHNSFDLEASAAFDVTPVIQQVDQNLVTPQGAAMKVSVYYQEAQVQKPTLYFAAGGTLDHQEYEHLLHHLVNEGYVVIAASYDGSFNDTHITDNFFAAFIKGREISVTKGINDDTRVGLIGHSSGAGALPSLAYQLFVGQGMGSHGRFVFGATPWVDFQFEKDRVLPADTNIVTQWYENDHGTDPRIYLDMYRHSAVNHKTFITVKKNTDHDTIKNGLPQDVVEQGIYVPLDALAQYTFEGVNKTSIFPEQDIDNEYLHILAEGTLPAEADFQIMMDGFTQAGSSFPCDSAAGGVYAPNPRKAECEAYATGRLFPVDMLFDEVATVSLPLPNPLQRYQEPVFDSQVTKITDRAIESGNGHPYPKQGSAWNSDSSIIRLQYRLYDAITFEELAVTAGLTNGQAYARMGSPASGSADIRWSKTDPNKMFTLDSNQKFVAVTINPERTQTDFVTLIDFSGRGYEKVTTGNNEGNLDHQDQTIIFAAKKPGDDKVYALLYHIGENDISWEKEVPRGLWDKAWNDPDNFDWVTIDPKAEYILVSAALKIYLYDIYLENELELATEANHGDIGIDDQGDSVYLQFKFAGERGIWSYNLRTHEKLKLLPSKYNGGHISCRNYQRLGWCYINTSEEGYREVFALKLDHASGTVERYAQTHISVQNRGCAQVNVSPDGKQVLFSSDWNLGAAEDYQWDLDHFKGCTDSDRRIKIDSYRVEIEW